MRKFWRIFRRRADACFEELQEVCVEAAPRPCGILRSYEDFWFARLGGRYIFEKKKFVDELEEARIAAAMEANPCREIVVWRPQYPVLIGDFRTLFEFLRENEVVDPPEIEGPSAPRNLAAILQAIENGDSEVPAAEYEDASMEEADAED